MKRTGVVQGFKSFLDKLHHQNLPLTNRESTHLLSALKSSFRAHLDEVHPRTTIGSDEPHKVETAASSTELQPHMRSSAAAAESHLSSILTNPLLAVSSRDQVGLQNTGSKLHRRASPINTEFDEGYAKVKAALREGQPPIDLLEEYHQTSKATVPIVLLCLRTFRDSIDKLSENMRLEKIRKVHPGKRSFRCLWTSGLHTSSECLANKQFIEILVHFMLLERYEQDLWDWIQLDIEPMDESALTSKKIRDVGISMLNKSRWKGRLLAIIAETKLQPSFNQSASADDAISVCLRASAIKSSARQSSSSNRHMRYLPLTPSMNSVFHQYSRHPRQFRATNPALFDTFINTMAASSNHPINVMFVAILLTMHPRSPSGNPLLDQLKLVLDSSSSDARLLQLHESIAARPEVYFTGTVRAAVQLEQNGNARGAAWIISKIPELFPTQIWYRQALANLRREMDGTKIENSSTEGKEQSLIAREAVTIIT